MKSSVTHQGKENEKIPNKNNNKKIPSNFFFLVCLPPNCGLYILLNHTNTTKYMKEYKKNHRSSFFFPVTNTIIKFIFFFLCLCYFYMVVVGTFFLVLFFRVVKIYKNSNAMSYRKEREENSFFEQWRKKYVYIYCSLCYPVIV